MIHRFMFMMTFDSVTFLSDKILKATNVSINFASNALFSRWQNKFLYPSLKNKNPGRKLEILQFKENEENIEESRKATNRFFRRLLLWPKDQRCTSTVFRETRYFWRHHSSMAWSTKAYFLLIPWFLSKTGWIFRRTLKRQRSLKSK